MVTLAGLEPATSPAPGEQGRSIPLELQRRHDLHDRLWRRRGGAIGSTPATPEQGDARAPLPAALCHRISNRTNCTHNVRQLAACFFSSSSAQVVLMSKWRHGYATLDRDFGRV